MRVQALLAAALLLPTSLLLRKRPQGRKALLLVTSPAACRRHARSLKALTAVNSSRAPAGKAGPASNGGGGGEGAGGTAGPGRGEAAGRRCFAVAQQVCAALRLTMQWDRDGRCDLLTDGVTTMVWVGGGSRPMLAVFGCKCLAAWGYMIPYTFMKPFLAEEVRAHFTGLLHTIGSPPRKPPCALLPMEH